MRIVVRGQDHGAEATLEVGELCFQHAAVGELTEANTLVRRTGHHGANGSLETGAMDHQRGCRSGGRCAKGGAKTVSETAERFVARSESGGGDAVSAA